MHFVKVALARAWPMGTAKLFVCVWFVLVRQQGSMRRIQLNNNR